MILDILLKLISLLHVIFVLFVILAPFSNSNYLLMLHAIFIPFVMLHWICNDNTCVLTVIERNLRRQISGQENVDDDCITCKLIEPVYDFRKDYATFSTIIYVIAITLWLISVIRLAYKYKTGEITSYIDLFRF